MKSFSKLKIFFLVFVVIVAVADFTLGIVLDKLYRFNLYGMSGGTINYFLRLNHPEVLVMGSSRAHQNLIPDSIDKSCFNLSHNGMSVAFQASLTDILAQQNALPQKYLILQVEPEEMVTDAKVLNKDIQHLKYYYPDNAFVRNEINEISRYEFLKYYFSSYKYNGTFFSLVKNAINTKDNSPQNLNGFEIRKRMEDDSLLTMLSTKSYLSKDVKNSAVFDNGSKKSGLFYLSHIVNICREKNIKLILYTSPYYANSIKDNNYIEKFNAWVVKNGIPYLDYAHKDMPELRDPWLWWDRVHLNLDGAKVFSRIFAGDFDTIRSID